MLKNEQKIKQFSNKNELNLFFFKMKIFSDIKKNNEKKLTNKKSKDQINYILITSK